jgi:hypothetical protein
LKTIQIPSPIIALGRPPCLDFGDYLYLCFGKDGTFTPTSDGGVFKPSIPQMTVHAGDLKGPYRAPAFGFIFTWTFTPSDGTPRSDGEVDVTDSPNCRDNVQQPICGSNTNPVTA